jgi:hypothetical protein
VRAHTVASLSSHTISQDDDGTDEADYQPARRGRGGRGRGGGGVGRTRAKKARVEGEWTDAERRKFADVLVDCGAPDWYGDVGVCVWRCTLCCDRDVLRSRTGFDSRSDVEMYELARHILTRCEEVRVYAIARVCERESGCSWLSKRAIARCSATFAPP